MESMSNAPYALPTARSGMRMGHQQAVDLMIRDGLWDVYNDFHMGMTGELVAEKYGISREEQDTYAAEQPHQGCPGHGVGTLRPGDRFRRDQGSQGHDDHRPGRGAARRQQRRGAGKLRPAFKRDGGTVTAGNAPSVNDGAAAVVAGEQRRHRARPEAWYEVEAYATGAREPEWVMMAPVKAVRNLLAKTGSAIGDFDLIELNEAFSVQAIAVMRELEADPDRVNVNGGAVALGHPIGCSGARILTTLMYAMEDRGAERGLAALCLGGGDAVALSIRRIA